jgi:hypothetical protein
VTPTARSLAHLRKQGCLAEVVEKRLPKVFITKDLFGFIDILAIQGGLTIAVQTTSGPHVADRIAKIRASEHLRTVLNAGWRIVVHGWRKSKGRWVLREEIVTG